MKFTIVKSQTIKSPSIERAGADATWIIYQTLDGKTGSVTIEKTDPTDDEIIAAVDAEQGKHDARIGRTLGG